MEPAATAPPLVFNMTQGRAAELDDFDTVLQLYWPRVFRFMLGSVRDHDLAQSLAQDCFLRAYRGRDQYRGEASLQNWLMQIAVNLVRDHARNRRLQFWRRASAIPVEGEDGAQSLAAGGANPEQRLLAKERVSAVWEALARLPNRQRTVFLLRFFDEMKLLEIAEITGLTENAVKIHLYRAVHTVRARVGRLK
jgi:RNA polymerase sigma-70 factor (ECF subfamily)